MAVKRISISLIEWYEDDIGQYQDKFPRSINDFVVDQDFEDDDSLGDFIMKSLETQYGVLPVLVSWDIPDEK